MASALPDTARDERVARRTSAGARAVLRQAEDRLLSLTLLVMVVLPVTEVVLRSLWSLGIPSLSVIVQHLVLVAGMLGAAVAARQDRFIALAAANTLGSRLGERWPRLLSYGIAAVVSTFLAVAAWRLLAVEYAAGTTLGLGLPAWALLAPLPLGFALIAWRLGGHAAARQGDRLALLAVLVAAVLGIGSLPFDTPGATMLGLGAVLLATVLGAPVFVAIGGAALLLFWGEDLPIAAIAIDHYRLATNPTLPAIPLFTVAGYLLTEGRAPERLVRVFGALFGWMRGGPAVVAVGACTFFTCFTGASGVTIIALGGLLLPLFANAGYGRRSTLGLVTGAGSAGVLLPPSLPLILYAVVAQVSIEQMFLAAIGPAVLMATLTALWGIRLAPRRRSRPPFDRREALAAIVAARWELLAPVLGLSALLSGLATPVEAAALTTLYVLIMQTAIRREMNLAGDVPRVLTESGLMVGGILLVLGVAQGLTNFLVDAEIPERAVSWAVEIIDSPWTFLALLNLALLAAGCLIDIYSAIVILVPLIVPIGLALGVDPLHLGLVFLANLELGYLTPPVGLNLFYASSRFERPLGEVCRAVMPLFLVLCAGVLLITFVPALSTTLPALLR